MSKLVKIVLNMRAIMVEVTRYVVFPNSLSFELMNELAGPNEISRLDDPNASFTFLMPDDFALNYFNYRQLRKLHSLPVPDQHR